MVELPRWFPPSSDPVVPLSTPPGHGHLLASTPAPTTSQDPIDLRRSEAAGQPERTRVRLSRHVSPFDELAQDERLKILIRVLCELVAYDEPDGTDTQVGTDPRVETETGRSDRAVSATASPSIAR